MSSFREGSRSIGVSCGFVGCFELFRSIDLLRVGPCSLPGDSSSFFISSVNLTEFYYKTCQKLGRQAADMRYYQIKRTLLHVVGDDDLSRTAGLEKCRQALNLSLADCFALALARRQNGLLLTTDRELSKVNDIDVKCFEVQRSLGAGFLTPCARVLQDSFFLRCLFKNLRYPSATHALINDGLPLRLCLACCVLRSQISSALPVPAARSASCSV